MKLYSSKIFSLWTPRKLDFSTEFLHRLPNHQICIIVIFFYFPVNTSILNLTQHFTSIFLLIITFAHPYTHISFMYPVPLEPNSQISIFFFFYQLFTFLKTSFRGVFSDISPYSFDVENFSYLRDFRAIKLCSTQKVIESTWPQIVAKP